jgi:hypothetical protein
MDTHGTQINNYFIQTRSAITQARHKGIFTNHRGRTEEDTFVRGFLPIEECVRRRVKSYRESPELFRNTIESNC